MDREALQRRVDAAKAEGIQVRDVLNDEEFSFFYGGLVRPTRERVNAMREKGRETRRRNIAERKAEREREEMETAELLKEQMKSGRRRVAEVVPMALDILVDNLRDKSTAVRQRAALEILRRADNEEFKIDRAEIARAEAVAEYKSPLEGILVDDDIDETIVEEASV